MAQIILSACAIVGVTRFTDSRGEAVTMYSVALLQTVARKVVEVTKVAQIEAELDAFAKECAALNRPLECSAYFPRQSGRKPSGYTEAKSLGKLARLVNEGLAS